MELKTLPYYHILRPPKKETKNPQPIFLLHGYGSNEKDLFSFSELFPNHNIIISLRAPITMGYMSYYWYDIMLDNTNTFVSNNTQAISVRNGLINCIEYACEQYDLDATNITVLGFSQGAVLAWSLGLSYPQKIKNVIALSGYINHEIITLSDDDQVYKNLAIYTSHGLKDEVIPFDKAKLSFEYIKNLNLSFDFKAYNQPHGINQENLDDMLLWYKKRRV